MGIYDRWRVSHLAATHPFRSFRLRWIAPPEKDAGTTSLEKRLWEAADQLRANSGLKAQEYSGPILGLIFLRFAEARFAGQRKKLELVQRTTLTRSNHTGYPGRTRRWMSLETFCVRGWVSCGSRRELIPMGVPSSAGPT